MLPVGKWTRNVSLAAPVSVVLLAGLTAIIATRPAHSPAEPSAPGASCMRTSEHVALRGRVLNEEVFGPPGFGETPAVDQRRSIPVLVLDSPVDICVGGADEIDDAPINAVSKVQLIYLPASAPRLSGRVSVDGELQRATNAFHYTPVTLLIRDSR
jgi:hypothetical protein